MGQFEVADTTVKIRKRNNLKVIMDDSSVILTDNDNKDHLLLQDAIPVEHDSDFLIKDKKQMKTDMDESQLLACHHNPLEGQKPADCAKNELCAGEREDIFGAQPLTTKYSENPKIENPESHKREGNSCLEKRRQFSVMHSPGSSAFHSFDSLSSELSSHSRHSVTSFLQAREGDAEDILFSLGLGGDNRISVPERFIFNSSSARGTILDVNRRNINEDDEDIFDANSMSYSSSWPDLSQFFERIPNRFIASTSSFGSNTDLSEPEESEAQQSSLPLIIEPEQDDDNSFDLMRHLRLNRIQNPSREHLYGDRALLEPVTEEFEVSSVGSGSARTKISNSQQDSLDSLGNASVLTKISRKQSEDSVKERTITDYVSTSNDEESCGDNQALQTAETDDSLENDKNKNSEEEYDNNDRLVCIGKTNNDAQTNIADSESGISSIGGSVLNLNEVGAMKPLVLGALALQTQHDSFELEEIATSKESLDKIEDKRTAGKYSKGRTKALKRENSDESSGFEDDTQVKKQSTESIDVSVDDAKTSLLDNQNDSNVNNNRNQSNLLVPLESSTPKTDVENRRSVFAKRNAWLTSKQKRVAFQEEASDLFPRSRSLDERTYSTYKLDSRRHSLDIPVKSVTETHEEFLAETFIPSDKDMSKEIMTPDKTAVNNIRRFLSSLMSIRTKFRKTEKQETAPTTDLPTTDHLPTTDPPATSLAFTGIPSIISVQTKSGTDHGTVVSGSSSGQDAEPARDERMDQSNIDMEGFVLGGADQNLCIEELDSFEEYFKKYRATFLAIEATSTAQESYYTKKLLARFAWDIVTIRKLRSLIKEELSTMQICLTNRRLYVSEFSNSSLPHGIVDQMKCLLSLQVSLQNYLLNLAENVPCFRWKTPCSPLSNRLVVSSSERTTEDMANEIKRSIFQELKQIFEEQLDSLRKELKEKDTVINELLVTVERIERKNTNPQNEH